MTTTQKRFTGKAIPVTNRNEGIKLVPEAREAKEFSVDPMYQTSVVTSIAYGKLTGPIADFKTANGELAISGGKPQNGYAPDDLFYLNVQYGDGQSMGSDGITFEDFEAVLLAMQDLHATALANGLSASPSMTAFNPSQSRVK
jgi:hypothetical protein